MTVTDARNAPVTAIHAPAARGAVDPQGAGAPV